jgi:hypothetical protein
LSSSGRIPPSINADCFFTLSPAGRLNIVRVTGNSPIALGCVHLPPLLLWLASLPYRKLLLGLDDAYRSKLCVKSRAAKYHHGYLVERSGCPRFCPAHDLGRHHVGISRNSRYSATCYP